LQVLLLYFIPGLNKDLFQSSLLLLTKLPLWTFTGDVVIVTINVSLSGIASYILQQLQSVSIAAIWLMYSSGQYKRVTVLSTPLVESFTAH